MFEPQPFDIVARLSQAKFIFREPIMKGHYVWRSNGIHFIEYLQNLFIDQLSHIGQVEVFPVGSIMSQDEYYRLYKDISEYKNVYVATTSGYAVRPENTSVLLRRLQERPQTIPLINTPLYRQFQSIPFLVDQRIWPAVSFGRVVDDDRVSQSIDAIISCVGAFFKKMLLPSVWIEQQHQFKNFAQNTWLPILPEDVESMTAVSTLYVLSHYFNDASGIEKKIIQYGFSERLLYAYCVMQEDRPYIVWPSSVAPFQVLLAEGVESVLPIERIKARIGHNRSSAHKLRDSVSTPGGSPVVLFKRCKKVFFRLSFTDQEGELNNTGMIPQLLQKSDSAIALHNQVYFGRCLNKQRIAFLSDRCVGTIHGATPLGNFYPKIEGVCEVCGEPNTPKRLLAPTTTKKTINEKLITQNYE